MNIKALIELIKDTDLDLKVRRYDTSFDPEVRQSIDEARYLLEKLRRDVLRGCKTIVLGDAWPLSTMAWILPAIRTIEEYGVTVVYAAGKDQITVTLENPKRPAKRTVQLPG